jgi:hypothetical protein
VDQLDYQQSMDLDDDNLYLFAFSLAGNPDDVAGE